MPTDLEEWFVQKFTTAALKSFFAESYSQKRGHRNLQSVMFELNNSFPFAKN